MQNKKAQAAMEFIMTYGWALLVVLAAIGALAYFGVLSPSRFLPSACTLPPGISCDEFKVTPTETTLIIRNGLGKTMTISQIEDVSGGCTAAGTALANGDQGTYTLTGCNHPVAGSKYETDVKITYSAEGNLTHTISGNIVAQVEG